MAPPVASPYDAALVSAWFVTKRLFWIIKRPPICQIAPPAPSAAGRFTGVGPKTDPGGFVAPTATLLLKIQLSIVKSPPRFRIAPPAPPFAGLCEPVAVPSANIKPFNVRGVLVSSRIREDA